MIEDLSAPTSQPETIGVIEHMTSGEPNASPPTDSYAEISANTDQFVCAGVLPDVN